MSLLAPGWLALLLLAGPILLLHMRRRRVVVSSLLLWSGLAGEARPSHALRRPPLSAALLLQLLALLLVAATLARPVLGAERVDHLVILLDGGARQDDARFEASLAEARRELRAVAAQGGVWSLVLVGERPMPVATRWPATATRLADAAPDLIPGDGAADWTQAAQAAALLVREGEATRVVLVGAGDDDLALARETLPGAVGVGVPVGLDLAITTARVTPGEHPGEWRVSGAVSMSAGAALGGGEASADRWPSASLTISFDPGGPGERRSGAVEVRLQAAADGRLRGAFDVATEATGGGVLSLEAGGSRAAFVLRDPPPSARVLYLGPGNDPLRRALLAAPGVELEWLPASEGLPAHADGYDLVVLDRVVVPEAPSTSVLWLGSARAAGEAEPERLIGERAVSWSERASLTRAVDWGSLALGDVWRFAPEPGAHALVSAVASGADAPLVLTLASAHGLDVRLAFDVGASDWPLHDSFPLFVRDLLAAVSPGAGAAVEAGCHVGLPCALPPRVVAATDPRGAAVALGAPAPAEGEPTATFVPRLAGVYELALMGGATRPLAVNAFREPPSAECAECVAGGASRVADLRRPLLAALALVLLAEAWLSRRGLTPRARVPHGRAARAPAPHSQAPHARTARTRAPYAWAARAGAARAWAPRAAVLALVGLAALDLRLPLPSHSGRLAVVMAGAADPGRGADADSHGDASPSPGVARNAGVGPATAAQAERPAASGADILLLPLPADHLDVEAAVDLASAVPPGMPTRVVVVGDGAETRGDLSAAAARAALRGLRVDVVPAGRAPVGEVVVRSVSAPATVLAGDRFALGATIYSASAAMATVSVYREGEEVESRSLSLVAGDNRVVTAHTEPAAGAFRYEVVVASPSHQDAGNDRQTVTVRVLPAARTLLVSDAPEEAAMLAAALRAQGVSVSTARPAELDPTGEQGVVVLMNVPARSLAAGQQAALEVAVRDRGLALVIMGGEHAFGPGGYYETPLERLSPTSSLVPRETPELAVAFVLDRSNSMRQYAGDAVRLDIAKAATARAFELLPEGARAALIAFDSTARTVAPLASAAEGESFRAALFQLDPRGGTALYPALVAAHAELAGSGAAAAHVIVMSDGLSQPGDFEGVLGSLREEGVTVSTIAIGPEADAEQLREIARLGGGTFYFSTDFSALPSIMAQEVMLQSGDLTEQLDTVPAWHDRRAPFLRAWPDEMPAVEGFVPTTLKPGATLHLSVTDDAGEVAPLLSSWRYGAGSVVALAAHGVGGWTSAWLGTAAYPAMWSHLLRQLAGEREAPLGLQLERRGDLLRVDVELAEGGAAASAPPSAGSPTTAHGEGTATPTLALLRPDGTALPLALHEIAPSRYRAETLLWQRGAYSVTARLGGESVQSELHVDYPAALDYGLADPGRLEAAASLTGGHVLSGLADVGRVAAWHLAPAQAWPLLLLGALAALLLELTARYAPDLLRLRKKGQTP